MMGISSWVCCPVHARLAKEFGMKFFAPVCVGHLARLPGGRAWINQDGKEVPSRVRHRLETGGLGDRLLKCPLDESLYEQWLAGATVCGLVNNETDRKEVHARWLAAPTRLAGIREGIVDGIHVDWEATADGICYCDDCFTRFLTLKGVKYTVPEKADRSPWLKEHNLIREYEESFHERRVAMFTSIRKKLQAVKPDLLFSSYGTKMSDFTRAMNTLQTPFVFLDSRHYYNDDRQPWWESYSARLKKEGYLWSPAYSPDGKRIAFVHYTGGRGQIFVMNSDGSNAVNISNNKFCDRSPAWSPAGMSMAFVSDRTGDWDVHVMNADGTGQRRRAGNPGVDRAPAWSPDGKRLAWESHVSGMPTVWVCDADGRNSHPLIASNQPLKVQQVEGWRDPPAIAEAKPYFTDNAFYLTDPVWSPDGSRIAAAGLGGPAGRMAVVLDANGAWMLQEIPWIPSIGGIRWSPDSRTLAFSSDMDVSGAFYVYTIPVGGGSPAMLDATQSAWPNEIMWKPQ